MDYHRFSSRSIDFHRCSSIFCPREMNGHQLPQLPSAIQFPSPGILPPPSGAKTPHPGSPLPSGPREEIKMCKVCGRNHKLKGKSRCSECQKGHEKSLRAVREQKLRQEIAQAVIETAPIAPEERKTLEAWIKHSEALEKKYQEERSHRIRLQAEMEAMKMWGKKVDERLNFLTQEHNKEDEDSDDG
jgi:hypothetical protein